MEKRKLITGVVFAALIFALIGSLFSHYATADQGSPYSWGVAPGDTLIWRTNSSSGVTYEKWVIADINQTSLGMVGSECVWADRFTWNQTSQLWDQVDLIGDPTSDPQPVVPNNLTWQYLGLGYGYASAFWAGAAG